MIQIAIEVFACTRRGGTVVLGTIVSEGFIVLVSHCSLLGSKK